MSALLTLLLPALMPALADGVRGVVAKFTGGAGAQPQSVAEAIQLMEANTARAQALAVLDNPGGAVSRWVANLRGCYRYVITGAIVLGAIPAAIVAPEAAGTLILLELAGASMSFIIGERMYLQLKR
jgi:hypothetical protein